MLLFVRAPSTRALFPGTFCLCEHKRRHFFQLHFALPAPLLLTLGKQERHTREWWVLRTRYQPRYYCYNQRDTETGIYQSSAKHQQNSSLSLFLFVRLCPRATTRWQCLVGRARTYWEIWRMILSEKIVSFSHVCWFLSRHTGYNVATTSDRTIRRNSCRQLTALTVQQRYNSAVN